MKEMQCHTKEQFITYMCAATNDGTQREQVEAAGNAAKSSNTVYLQVRVKLTQNQSIKTVI